MFNSIPLGINPDFVSQILEARFRREELFPNLFSDPAWDILLRVFLAEITQQRASVTVLAMDTRVPLTTALRWIDVMVKEGMLIRHTDQRDRRRTFIELRSETSSKLRDYFQGLERLTII